MPLNKITYDYDFEHNKIIVKKDDVILKLHACLCDIVALDQYHKYNAQQIKLLNEQIKKEHPELNLDLTKNPSYPSLVDTFYYDYDSFDEIYEVLAENGFSIIERNN